MIPPQRKPGKGGSMGAVTQGGVMPPMPMSRGQPPGQPPAMGIGPQMQAAVMPQRQALTMGGDTGGIMPPKRGSLYGGGGRLKANALRNFGSDMGGMGGGY